jgi:hypothetical protein
MPESKYNAEEAFADNPKAMSDGSEGTGIDEECLGCCENAPREGRGTRVTRGLRHGDRCRARTPGWKDRRG